MTSRLAILATAVLTILAGSVVVGTAPASAHGFWPDSSTTGYGAPLNSPIGDLSFTGSCGASPLPACFQLVQYEHIVGKLTVGSGYTVVLENSWLEGDGSDAIAAETTGTGHLIISYSTISGDYSTAAVYGRFVTIQHAEFTDLPATGVILNAEGIIEDSWFHDWSPGSNPFIYGIQLFDVWQGCVGTPVPSGCGNGPVTIVRNNFLDLMDYSGSPATHDVWASLWAAPAFGTNAASEWIIQRNFFVGGAYEVAHLDNSSGDVGNVVFRENHLAAGQGYTLDISGSTGEVCETEEDDFVSPVAAPSPEGDSC